MKIYVRHGILSKAKSLARLAEFLEKETFGKAEIDNSDYDWKREVVFSGLTLASEIMRSSHRDVALVGHSQGGLVCRVAAVAIKGDLRFDFNALPIGPERDVAKALLDWRATADGRAEAREKKRLVGQLLLATPNSGALTYGQLSLLGRLLRQAAGGLLEPYLLRNLQDLTSPRLHRIFQHCALDCRVATVSGSFVNRYSVCNHGDLKDVPVIGRLGLYLDLPNDLVVEDSSVDLSQSTLPHEFRRSLVEHHRMYPDCIDVEHRSIHDLVAHSAVARIVRKVVQGWMAS